MAGALPMDSTLLDDAAKFAGGGAGFGMGLYGIRWFIMWLTGRHDRREDRLDKRWSEYMEAMDKHVRDLNERNDRLEKRMNDLEEEVERCHTEKRELQRQLAKLQGFATGRGEAAQIGQIDASLKNMFEKGAGA